MTYLQIFKYFQKLDKKNCCFLGIRKSLFPKWIGWKLIDEYKKIGVQAKDINDPILDVMVENFYMVLFLKEGIEYDKRRSS